MPCGGQFFEGVEMLRKIGKTEVGVHLTLTGNFKPCIENHSLTRSLLKKNGAFVSGYKSFAARYFLGKLTSGDIYSELEKQIKKVNELASSVATARSAVERALAPAHPDGRVDRASPAFRG